MHDVGKEMLDRRHAVMLPFLPRSVIFPGRRRQEFFSINIGEKYFFAEMG